MNDRLSQHTGHAQAISRLVSESEAELRQKLDELNDLQRKIDEKNEEYRLAINLAEAADVEYKGQKAVIEKSIDELNQSQDALSQRLLEAVDKNANLKIDNARLEAANKKFREYEEKAMKILDTKERELLARQHKIDERENMRPRVPSLLPERD